MVQTRLATINDKDFIISLIPRLTEFGPPGWRDVDEMAAVDTQILTDKLLNNTLGTTIFIAENEDGLPLGFIHLQMGNDYYYKEKHGHISDVIVSPAASGQGIGTLLIHAAEEWARAQGFRWITLSVFAQNVKARALYNNLGYGEDIVKYVKQLE